MELIMKNVCYVFLFLFCLSTNQTGAQNSLDNVKSILGAAKIATSDSDRLKLYQKLSEVSVTDPEDIKSIHRLVKSLLNNNPADDVKSIVVKGKLSEPLVAILARSTSPELHTTINELLEEESNSLPDNYTGGELESNTINEVREEIRMNELEALIKAAGKGKNETALPVLREIVKKGGLPAGTAEKSIGLIGKSEDLRNYINTIESDPNARIDLSGFGQSTFDAIMDEYNNGSLQQEQKERLIGFLPDVTDKSYLPKYLKLTESKDRVLSSIATARIARVLKPDDEKAIKELLSSPDLAVRMLSMTSLERMMDQPEYVELAASILNKKSNDYEIRVTAAHDLGHAKVEKDIAREALIRAAEDKNPVVSHQAKSSLNILNGRN